MGSDGSALVIDKDLAFVHPQLQQALNYYRSKMQGGVVRRADLDPVEMRPFLPNIALFDVEPHDDGNRYLYRLMGTQIAAHYGEHTGCDIDDVLAPEVLARTRRVLDTALANGEPIRAAARVADPRKAWLFGEGLAAPLSRDGTATDMVLLVLYFWPEDKSPTGVSEPLRRA